MCYLVNIRRIDLSLWHIFRMAPTVRVPFQNVKSFALRPKTGFSPTLPFKNGMPTPLVHTPPTLHRGHLIFLPSVIYAWLFPTIQYRTLEW